MEAGDGLRKFQRPDHAGRYRLALREALIRLHFHRGISFGLLALIVARELMQLPMAVAYRASHTLRSWLRYDFRASPLGKAATIAQFVAIAAVIAGLPARFVAWGAFALGTAALIDYVRRAVAISRQRLHEQAVSQQNG